MLKELLQSLLLCFYRKRVSDDACVAYFERIAAEVGKSTNLKETY